MASEKPSTLDQVRAIFAAHGRHDVTYYAVIDDVVAALDAARNEGRCEREAEIAQWIGNCGWPVTAEDIKRGAGRKERP